MKKISRIYVILCTLCLIACTDKDVHNFRFNDWPNYCKGITSNPFYNEVFTVTDNLAEVKIYAIAVKEGEEKKKLLSVKKFKDGLIRENYESPCTSDDLTIRYYYDEYNRLVKEDYHNDEGMIVPELSFEYTYEYDAEIKAFIQKVYCEGKLQSIFREAPIKTGYRLEKESIARKKIETAYEVDISQKKVVQFQKIYAANIGSYYYDFAYDGIRLNRILLRSVTNRKEVYINGYETVNYDTNGNIAEMMVYDYDREDKTKRGLTGRLLFSDYDKAGNWCRQEWIHEKDSREPEITIREFIYTE